MKKYSGQLSSSIPANYHAALHLAQLRACAWQVEPALPGVQLPAEVMARYGELPADLVAFLSGFSLCVNPSNQAWFISASDLSSDDAAFRFDEFERMSLAAAGCDETWATEIQAFWQAHLPIFLCVHGSYQYFAYSLAGSIRGHIVYGAEPEFETCTTVAPSLTAFLDAFADMLISPSPAYPFNLAIPRPTVNRG